MTLPCDRQTVWILCSDWFLNVGVLNAIHLWVATKKRSPEEFVLFWILSTDSINDANLGLIPHQITLNCIDPELRSMSHQSLMAWYIFPVPFVWTLTDQQGGAQSMAMVGLTKKAPEAPFSGATLQNLASFAACSINEWRISTENLSFWCPPKPSVVQPTCTVDVDLMNFDHGDTFEEKVIVSNLTIWDRLSRNFDFQLWGNVEQPRKCKNHTLKATAWHTRLRGMQPQIDTCWFLCRKW